MIGPSAIGSENGRPELDHVGSSILQARNQLDRALSVRMPRRDVRNERALTGFAQRREATLDVVR